MGRVGEARATYAEALSFAEAMGHPYAVATALMLGATLSFEAGDPQAVLEASGRSISLASENGFHFVLAHSSCLHGWALARLGQPQEGVALLRKGLAGIRDMGALLLLRFCLTCLAQACLAGGWLDEGLAATREALEALEGNLARYPVTTLLRDKAELLARRGDVEAARVCLHQSLAMARDSGAKLHELRAALGLAELLPRTGESHTLRPLLEGLRDALSEGQDLIDHRRVQRLLAEPP
jgi:tetratricopeptide (TPR) repeat protein